MYHISPNWDVIVVLYISDPRPHPQKPDPRGNEDAIVSDTHFSDHNEENPQSMT